MEIQRVQVAGAAVSIKVMGVIRWVLALLAEQGEEVFISATEEPEALELPVGEV